MLQKVSKRNRFEMSRLIQWFSKPDTEIRRHRKAAVGITSCYCKHAAPLPRSGEETVERAHFSQSTTEIFPFLKKINKNNNN